MEIWVLSSASVYYESCEVYFGASVHTSEDAAYESMITQILDDVRESWDWGEGEPPVDEDDLRIWMAANFAVTDASLSDREAKAFIDGKDFMYRIERYVANWEVSI